MVSEKPSKPASRIYLSLSLPPGVRSREIGIVISKRGETHRINFFGGLEETAYYTTSLTDALNRGIRMAKIRGGSGKLLKSAGTATPRAAAAGLHPGSFTKPEIVCQWSVQLGGILRTLAVQFGSETATQMGRD
jgi:hypothetical protein